MHEQTFLMALTSLAQDPPTRPSTRGSGAQPQPEHPDLVQAMPWVCLYLALCPAVLTNWSCWMDLRLEGRLACQSTVLSDDLWTDVAACSPVLPMVPSPDVSHWTPRALAKELGPQSSKEAPRKVT